MLWSWWQSYISYFLNNYNFIKKKYKKFAKIAKKVIGNDINENTINMAKHNSSVYKIQ